eukprot:TRINITY_DN828_c0_g1_i10.p1 TRINITY_DN828_c0_g1~~TRINITY_DN828_c0_g1_i10.p1  ORF type:complete len:229 (-),score=65.98 TRINITY_DN828_c0_g1_i10:184-786(-)
MCIRDRSTWEEILNIMIISDIISFFATFFAFIHFPWETPKELLTATRVDVPKYMGEWHEIARLPYFFERDCQCAKATYTLNKDGTVKVLNECNWNGGHISIEGKAWAVDATNTKLKVSFQPLWAADYWIIDLDPNYQWAIVGEPWRNFLFILARNPKIDTKKVEQLIGLANHKGFDTRNLILRDSNFCDKQKQLSLHFIV